MSIHLPSYIYRDVEKDSSPTSTPPKNLAVRVALAALPFFTLYKPFAYPLSLAAGSLRVFTSMQELSAKRGAFQCMSTAAAIAGLAGTLFAHPLGMLIASLHDVAIDLHGLASALSEGDHKDAMLKLLASINDGLYLGLFLGGSAHMVAASLSAQFVLGAARSYLHFKKGDENIEGASQLLMAFIRGHQAVRSWQAISIELDKKTAEQEGKPYLPLANRAQKFFVNAGYRINTFARWTIRQIGHLTSPLNTQGAAAKVQQAAMIALAGIVSLGAFALSTPCYLAASYVGTGRFEKIDGEKLPEASNSSEIKVLFQNICGQDPWSRWFGGVLSPFEFDEEGNQRVNLIIESILKENPDVYCGQEYDDLKTTETIAQALAEKGYTCVRDLGCNDPFLNHSGLFLAIKDQAAADSIGVHEFAPEHTSGMGSWCNRVIMEVTTNGTRIVNIHLNPGGKEHEATRLAQLKYYVAPLMQKGPTLVLGDSNLNTAELSPEQKEAAGLIGVHNALEGEKTCTDEGKHKLIGTSKEGCTECAEYIDVILHRDEEIKVSNIALHPGNSDHYGISFAAIITQKH